MKAKLSAYETKLPVLLLEMESGGYSGISVLLSLYGLPNLDSDTYSNASKRQKMTPPDFVTPPSVQLRGPAPAATVSPPARPLMAGCSSLHSMGQHGMAAPNRAVRVLLIEILCVSLNPKVYT